MNIPENLKYTVDHEWVMIEGERAKVGITDYAQDALGDVVFVDIPELGKRVTVGETVTEVESTKSVSDIYAPLEGEIIEINQELDDSPELLNGDPYGEGWIFILKLSETTSTESLLSAKDYRELVEG
ncbi:MAG: glycine cleavage system protein GcvH [Acidimicrobiales bacterium]|jgi:glycine cleavage system H protein|nr:glycine cleavage system protein H [Actinomycetota bacterium]MCH2615788.1 glycine cleavage system protein GcvH [Acidimicrobiales bacterium]MED5446456.1 glycine cleavage system protein GcvH [Actinomycetota bacterium]|tara:strand:+ start:1921 stop:2301 length:381 start_codon:yes stop_codon:yes gene_type:complete